MFFLYFKGILKHFKLENSIFYVTNSQQGIRCFFTKYLELNNFPHFKHWKVLWDISVMFPSNFSRWNSFNSGFSFALTLKKRLKRKIKSLGVPNAVVVLNESAVQSESKQSYQIATCHRVVTKPSIATVPISRSLDIFMNFTVKGKCPEVPFHEIPSSYSYFEVIWFFAPIQQEAKYEKFIHKAQ